MSVIIRLQNLPLTAGASDVRTFFSGLKIPDGAVHIVGGIEGDVFIGFASDEDARQAMRRDRMHIHQIEVRLFLSSRAEMSTIIDQAKASSHRVSPPVPVAAKPEHVQLWTSPIVEDPPVFGNPFAADATASKFAPDISDHGKPLYARHTVIPPALDSSSEGEGYNGYHGKFRDDVPAPTRYYNGPTNMDAMPKIQAPAVQPAPVRNSTEDHVSQNSSQSSNFPAKPALPKDLLESLPPHLRPPHGIPPPHLRHLFNMPEKPIDRPAVSRIEPRKDERKPLLNSVVDSRWKNEEKTQPRGQNSSVRNESWRDSSYSSNSVSTEQTNLNQRPPVQPFNHRPQNNEMVPKNGPAAMPVQPFLQRKTLLGSGVSKMDLPPRQFDSHNGAKVPLALPPKPIIRLSQQANPMMFSDFPLQSPVVTQTSGGYHYIELSRLPTDMLRPAALEDFIKPSKPLSLSSVKVVYGPHAIHLHTLVRFENEMDKKMMLRRDGEMGIRVRQSSRKDFDEAVDGLPAALVVHQEPLRSEGKRSTSPRDRRRRDRDREVRADRSDRSERDRGSRHDRRRSAERQRSRRRSRSRSPVSTREREQHTDPTRWCLQITNVPFKIKEEDLLEWFAEKVRPAKLTRTYYADGNASDRWIAEFSSESLMDRARGIRTLCCGRTIRLTYIENNKVDELLQIRDTYGETKRQKWEQVHGPHQPGEAPPIEDPSSASPSKSLATPSTTSDASKPPSATSTPSKPPVVTSSSSEPPKLPTSTLNPPPSTSKSTEYLKSPQPQHTPASTSKPSVPNTIAPASSFKPHSFPPAGFPPHSLFPSGPGFPPYPPRGGMRGRGFERGRGNGMPSRDVFFNGPPSMFNQQPQSMMMDPHGSFRGGRGRGRGGRGGFNDENGFRRREDAPIQSPKNAIEAVAASIGPRGTVLACQGFPKDFTLEDVMTTFEEFDPDQNSVRMRMGEDGVMTGECLIACANPMMAAKAAAKLDKSRIRGNSVSVSLANP